MTKKKMNELSGQPLTMQVGSHTYWWHPKSASRFWVAEDPALPHLAQKGDCWLARPCQYGDMEYHASTPLEALKHWLEKQSQQTAQLLKGLEEPELPEATPALPASFEILNCTYTLDRCEGDGTYRYESSDEEWPALLHFPNGWYTSRYGEISNYAFASAKLALRGYWDTTITTQNSRAQKLQERLGLELDIVKRYREYFDNLAE